MRRQSSYPWLCGLLLTASLPVQGHQFEVSTAPGSIQLRSLTTKPVYDLCVEIGAGSAFERLTGPAILTPNATWNAPRPDHPHTPLVISIAFRDESGIPGLVFATLGHTALPPLAIPSDVRLQDIAPLIAPDWPTSQLLWRDTRDLPPSDRLTDCAHLPPLRRTTLDHTPTTLDARPLSGVIQVIGQDTNGQAVSQALTLADAPATQPLPFWVRHPALWSVLGLLLGLSALASALRQGTSRNA